MKEKIVIIGSGFAGMWSALSAARLIHLHNRDDIDVIVLAPKPELCVRPRLYEENARQMVSPLLPLYHSVGVQFFQGTAEQIDSAQKRVVYRDCEGKAGQLNYDRLVIASGSRVKQDLVPGDQRAYL